MPEEENKHNIFLSTLIVFVFIAIASSFYLFYFKKDFDFITETKCNPESETCFYRDCTNPDDCPPNNLSYYNQYLVKANDFDICVNEDCTDACTNRLIDCVKLQCTDEDINNEVCISPTNIEIQN
jgi:hypothetical protein